MNKKTLYRYFTILMAFVVLLTSTGIGFVESHCMMRGKSLQLVSKEKKPGCKSCHSSRVQVAAHTKALLKKADCCVEKQQYKNVAYLSSFSHRLAKILKGLADAFPGLPEGPLFAWINWLLAPQTGGQVTVYSFSSLFYGRSLLVFNQVFRI